MGFLGKSGPGKIHEVILVHLEIVQKMYPTNVYVTRLTTIWNSSRNQVKINIGDSSGSYAHGQSCVKLLNWRYRLQN